MKILTSLFLLLLTNVNTIKASCSTSGKKLVVNNGSTCELTSSLTGLDEVRIYGSVFVSGTPGGIAPSIEATDIYIYSTGKILADGRGFAATNGPGKGSMGGSGGSHGGRGGMSTGTYLQSNEAVAYGGIERPTEYGSGGGCVGGGKGGGVITLKATASIQVDGLVSANGNDGGNCGGGSGGSIYIETDYFKGSGMVTSRGGAGNGTGGGGGGGRISIVHNVSQAFTGDVFADGGDISSNINQLSLSMTGSSYIYDSYYYGDMSRHSTRSWRAKSFSTSQYLEARLTKATWIVRTAIRGHPDDNYWVTKYKIQYYNDTASTWVPLSFPSDGFTGNTNKNGIVYNDLFAPIYTTKLRFFPQSWSSGIGMAVKLYGYTNYETVSVPPTCSSITTAGPGGPGTIFMLQSGAGVRTVLIDARGKDPKVKKTENCNQFESEASGAVAWINDDSSKLDEIILTYGAHLVLSNYTTVSQILSDGSNKSVVHVLPKAKLKLGNTLTVPCFVYPDGVLEPASGTTIYIEEWLYVLGNITFSDDESVIVNGNFTMQIQNFTTFDLKVGTDAIMTVVPLESDSIFPLSTEKFSVNGTFKCNIINFTDIQEFRVGSAGIVDMVPVSTDMYMGKIIYIQGSVNLHHSVSIVHPCEQFYITGSESRLTWTDKANITMECLDVFIDGYFKPGTINFGDGAEKLRIGSYGDFEFAASSPVLTNSFWANGTTNITNIAEFKSLNGSDLRIEVFVVDAGGYLYLNSLSSPKLVNGLQVDTTYNNIRARYLIVDGYLNTKILSTHPGIDKVTVGSSGTLLFTPYDNFLVHEIEVNGIMKSYNPVIFRGKVLVKVKELRIGESGTMILDNNVQGTKMWTGVSEMPFHHVYVHGILKPGKILNRYINTTDEGWNYLYLHSESSVFEFETEEPFLIGTADINGTFTSFKPIAMRAPTTIKRLTVFIGWTGHVTFNSEASHPTGPFASNSSIYAEHFVTDTGSLFEAGNTHFDIDNVEIGGTMYAQPESKVEIRTFTVTNTGSVNITTPIVLECDTLNVAGLLDIDFRRWPDNTNEGNANSDILISQNIIVSGTFQAGSLYIETPMVTISGTLDISGGGYLNDKGAGKGVLSSSGASGGSYGGRGGRGSNVIAGMSYGSIFKVGTWGSGGGSVGSNHGGRGGGRLHAEVGQFTLNGTMRSNGDNAVGSLAGGGAGGSLYVKCVNLSMTGYLYSNGGSGSGNGGGGAGGRINFFFNQGFYESGHVTSIGGSGYEPGGPGIMYFHSDTSRNLRVDNKCQKPTVTEPSGETADISHFNTYISTGGIAYLLPETDDFVYDFTMVEIYGGAHLTVKRDRIRIKAIKVVGDDTGHFHVPPYHTLELIESTRYRRTNVTYHPFIYKESTWILPEATVEFRESLDEKGKGMSSSACTSAYLNSNTVKIWGTVVGDLAHLLVSSGAKLIFELSANRQLTFSNITIQNGGTLELKSNFANETDIYELQVQRTGHTGILTVQGNGEFIVRNLNLQTDIVNIHDAGTIKASGEGYTGGDGAGASSGGGGYGGRGGVSTATGQLPGKEYGSIYGPCHFGSGGYGATLTYGAGGGMILIMATQTVIVEGVLESNGHDSSSSSIAGGSGGCISINTYRIEGKGTIQVNGGNGASTTGAGGGGRMMIYYKDTQFWQGKWTAYGGITGSTPGGAGTVLLQDTITDVKNRTLIIDNNGRAVQQSEIASYTLSGYAADPGRTWIHDSGTSDLENLRILGKANLALHPSLTQPYQLKPLKFEGDKTGVLHVGPGQTVVIQHPDDLEFLVNVFVYNGGKLILPQSFECYDVDFNIWGTLGIVDMTVGHGCNLYLSATGNTNGISTVSEVGVYDFNTLTVKAGGEVSVTHDLTGVTSSMSITAGKLWVQGEGHVHAVQVNITAETLIVDDLGQIIGDLHSVSCVVGDGFSSGSGASGAGHGGRGGRGSGQMKTGAPYGQVFDAVDRGCKGGDNSNSNTGGRGGGVVFLKVTGTLQNDGEVTCNGENGRGSHAGGGSGGSINLDIHNIKGFGKFQSIGGDGSGNGGAGSGGRISMDFADNKTYTGSFDTYGGLGKNNGSPGTSFFYHTVNDHTTLLLNNLNRGPNGDTNTIEDYFNLESDQLKAWFLPEHGRHTFAGTTSSYEFNELQIYGKAQLAVLTDPVESNATIYFHNMIGDRSGAIHVGKNEVMDLERPTIDLPFSVHVYDGGYLGLAPDTFIHGVDIFLNGTLANVENLTLHHEGKLWLNIDGRTEGLAASTYNFQFVHVKNAGYLHMISDPVTEPSISFSTISLNIDGGGLVRGTYVYFFSENITIDSGGVLTANGLGYELADGDRTDSSGNVRKGLHGVINPGHGYTSSLGASGAGYGGSGGRGHYNEYGGEPYGDIYEPTLFGSAGGGPKGGAGGGRIWLNVTNTILIDGTLTASGDNGVTQNNYNSISSTGWVSDLPGGGGSGGSIWLHCYRITGYGIILARGGNGTLGTYRYTTSSYQSSTFGSGGGAGGRIAMYFQKNDTFSEFRYLANGGWPGKENTDAESGGPGTVYLYHTVEVHRTLIIDNNGAPVPREKYVNWGDVTKDGGRAWILPQSGVHDFAAGAYVFQFEEIQIYGNGHFAVLNPENINVIDAEVSGNVDNFNVTIDFKYMIGDRSGTVHVADKQVMDLIREEIDLPFNCYVYFDGFLGLAPMTYVHGVEIHLAGVLANVVNITLHHGGYLWLQNGGRTLSNPHSHYTFDYVLIQDEGKIDCTTDAVTDEGITFYLKAVTVEGGGILHGTYMTFNVANVTVDAGGVITTEGKGYNTTHTHATHTSSSVHGNVNLGKPTNTYGGGGHGGSAGEGANSQRAGFAYGNIYEPDLVGSSGGSGGEGGGVIWMNVTHTIMIDGEVNSRGADGTAGGSGGSIWMYCELIKGYGKITAHGGHATHNSGGGGAGGRVAVYFNRNETMSAFRFQAIGGKGGSSAENGGAGTVFVYNMLEDHKTLIIDNGGHQPSDKFNVIDSYANLSSDSCRTWILPESGDHFFAGGGYKYHFHEFQMYGAAHLAFLPEPLNQEVDVYFLYMIGDRSGTVHLGNKQVMDLNREEIDLPFSVRAYAGSYLGLAPFTIVHGVSIWMHGELANIDNITLHHNGLLSLETGGHTKDLDPDYYQFNWVRIQENATVRSLTDPVTEPGIDFLVHFSMYIEGGGTFVATNVSIQAINITIDDGGALHSDSLGYRYTDAKTEEVNIGKGTTDSSGSSGAGHGGTSGRGAGTPLTGQPYGHLYQPFIHGSAGGGDGGQGGGMIWLNATNMIEIDGRLSANAGNAISAYGGGGSGGSIWVYCRVFRGMGTIASNGGNQSSGGGGGGGAGGRIAVYLYINNTYLGNYESHGGSVNTTVSTNSQPGGPGTVLLYHQKHDHETLYINNDGLTSNVGMIADYTNLTQDSFKAWILPNAGEHWLANGNFDFQFEELQIYGNAHIAFLPKPFDHGVKLHFQHMIGDRTGFVHIGNHQVMDLRRKFIDTPFSTYVYDGGYLGLAPDTNLERVFVRLEGTMDHVINMTLIDGGSLRLHLTGSTNSRDRLNYHINGSTVIKAKSYINCSNPRAHEDQYQLVFNYLRVEGGGAINGSFMKMQATDFTVDDGGIVSVNNGGHSPDKGQGVGQWHRFGASGASHGGTGGQGACSNHLACKLSRSKAYGDLYQPLEFGGGGSGGRGGSGGGRLEIEVNHTLTVDGYIMANSEDVLSVSSWSGASGGSGGSILINTVNFTGSHTGHIQSLGGVADTSIGGGGAGGRIALYQNSHHTIPPYRGFFDTYGGRGNSGTGAEAGASGTAYIRNTQTAYSQLLVDNHKQLPRDEHSALLNEGYRVDLSIKESSYSSTKSFTGTKGHQISSTSNTYVYSYPYCYSGTYYLMYLFDQTLANVNQQYYLAASGSTTITVTLAGAAFVTKLKIYPTANYPSKFKVTGYNGASSFVVTTNYVTPRSPVMQGSYLELPIMQTATKFEFLVVSTQSSHSLCSYRASLTEIEVFADAQNIYDRYKYTDIDGATTWIFAKDNNELFDFDELTVQGGGHLAFNSSVSLTSPVDINVGMFYGDKTGYIHIGYKQELFINDTNSDIPFNAHVYETAKATYPPRPFFYQTHLHTSGEVII